MRLQSLKVVSIIMYFICALATVMLIIPSFIATRLSHSEKFIITAIIFVLGYMASRLLCIGATIKRAQKIMKINFACLFLIYVIVVIDFTLISESFGRNISNIFLLSKSEIKEYLTDNTNLVPFGTIRLYINAYRADNIEHYIVFENLIGNFFVFMPFAFFLTIVLEKANNSIVFLCVISATVIIIELLQIVFLTGSADIDDFILNVAGAMAMFGVLKIKAVRRFADKIVRRGDTDAG